MRIAPLNPNRRFFSQLSLFVAALLTTALPLHADDQAANIETAPNSVGGIINANDALVRSGATDTAYATMSKHGTDNVNATHTVRPKRTGRLNAQIFGPR